MRRVEHECSSHGASIRGVTRRGIQDRRCLQRPNPRVVIRPGGGGGPRSKDAWNERTRGRAGRPAAGAPLPPPLPSLRARPAHGRPAVAAQDAEGTSDSALDVLLSKMVRRRSAEVRLEAREPTLDWQRFAEGFRVIEQNVEKVVQGKQPEIRLALAALDGRGPHPDRGRPRRRQDDARQGDRPLDRLLVPPDPVHARPPADRRDRRQRLQPGARGLRVQARRDLREHRARRRDQPREPQDPVRAPRVHGGAPDHRRHGDLPARHAVHGDRDPEPDRARGHLPAPRGAARPLHDADRDRLPLERGRGRDPRDPRRALDAPRHRPGRRRPVGARDDRADAAGARLARRPPRTSSIWSRGRAGIPTSTSGRARGPRSCCCARRARSPPPTSATT